MAPDSQHRSHRGGAEDIGGVALVLAGVRCDVQIDDGELGVAVLAVDGEAAGGVVNILEIDKVGENGHMLVEVKKGKTDLQN